MNKPARYALLILLFSTLLAAGLLVPELLLKGVIEPLATLAWAAWRLIATVDQGIYWVIVITLCLVTMIRLVPPSDSGTVQPEHRHTAHARVAVERWQRLLNGACADPQKSAALRADLTDLFASVVADGEPIASPDVERRLASARRSLPPSAAQFLAPGGSSQRKSLRAAALFAWLPHWLRPRSRVMNASELHSVDELIQWMEATMEIQHDQ